MVLTGKMHTQYHTTTLHDVPTHKT